MSTWHSRRMHIGFATFAVAMIGLAAWVWLRFGVSLVTAVVAAIAIACVAAMLYVWWLARRAVKTVERAAPGTTAEKRLRRQRS